ncbi:MAG: DUF3306 domain-containing protein, partial [Pseudomonadota bacterium]
MSRGETFLGRWSRLKQEGEAQPPEEAPPAAAPTDAAPAEDTRTDEEVLTDLGLPHPDDLKPGDDISGFMKQAVPAKMKRMAMRQLWRLNPVLANVDGLVDYGEDYTDSAMVVENMQTLYQVGKGMFVELEEPEDAEADAPEELVEAEAQPDDEATADADPADADPADEAQSAEDSEANETEPDAETTEAEVSMAQAEPEPELQP